MYTIGGKLVYDWGPTCYGAKPPATFTSDLNKIITERNTLLKKAIKSQKVDDWSKFKKTKNMVARLIRQSKKDYFKTEVAANRNNPKKL